MEFNNQVAVIAGGGSGLGAATATSLAAKGVKPVILDQNLAAAEAVAKQSDGLAFECNVCDPDAVKNAIDAILSKCGPARILVNCAGIAPAKRIVDREGPISLEEFNRVIQVNLIGSFNVMRLVAAQMMQAELINDQRGVIINTASVAATDGQIGQAAYSASKGGVASMTLPAAREFAQHGIRVVCIAPGVMATPMMMNMPEKVRAGLEQAVTFPKRLGLPEEFAELVKCIVHNDYINAEVIRLDGGLRMA